MVPAPCPHRLCRRLLLLLLCICALSPSALQSCAGALLDRSRALGLESMGPRTHVAAMADCDSDKHTDIIAINSSNATDASRRQWSVEVWIWSTHDSQIDSRAVAAGKHAGTLVNAFVLHPARTIASAQMVTNVVPGDFNFDGIPDLLLSGPAFDVWHRSIQWLRVHIGLGDGFFSAQGIDLPPATDQVLVGDFNNDLHLDLFGERFLYEPAGDGNDGAGPGPGMDPSATVRSYWTSQVSHDGLHTLSFQIVAQDLNQDYPAYPRSMHSLPGPAPARLRMPHSHATVDIDGDCQADLVVTSVDEQNNGFIEIWINRPLVGPVLWSFNQLPPGAGQLAFVDVDNDGNIDVIVPVFGSGDASAAAGERDQMLIYYAQARPLCDSFGNHLSPADEREAPGATRGCRSVEALCTGDPDVFFDFMRPSSSGSSSGSSSADLLSFTANTVAYHFPAAGSSATGGGGRMFSAWDARKRIWNTMSAAPFTPRLGDINLDGFPDMLLSVTASAGQYGVAELYLNVPCPTVDSVGPPLSSSDAWLQCSPAARMRGRRIFTRSAPGLDAANHALAQVSGANMGASFFDFENNGELDIVLTAVQPSSISGAGSTDSKRLPPAGTHITRAYVNAFLQDAYFLTALASNGVCPAYCPVDAETAAVRFPHPKPYGVSMPGATFRIAMTDLAGHVHSSVGAQLSQSAYLSLSSPAVTFGLGRTNTFLDAFAFGIGINSTQLMGDEEARAMLSQPPSASDASSRLEWHSRQWVGLIPNAQVVVFPYPPLVSEQWTLELFVAPSAHLKWVCVAWATLLTMLACVIGALHLREQREDEKEKRTQQLMFAF